MTKFLEKCLARKKTLIAEEASLMLLRAIAVARKIF